MKWSNVILKRAKKREKKNKALRDLQENFQLLMNDREQRDPNDPNDDDESTTLSHSSNSDRSREEDAEYIRKLEAMLAASKGKTKSDKQNRRQSVADVGANMSNRMVYSLTSVKEEEKLKVANGHTLLDLFMRIEPEVVKEI